MSTQKSVNNAKSEYRRLYAYVQTLPADSRWTYGAQLKTLKAAAYAEIEALRYGQ